MQADKLRKEIFDISYKKGVGHIGSNIGAIDSIVACYNIKNKLDYFVLSSGHANLALSVVLKEDGFPVDPMVEGTHPDMDFKKGIFASTGSLGHGIGIAVGMAIANRGQRVFCVCSDGETKEGSFWEALDIAVEQQLTNLKIVVNANGYGAYKPIDTQVLISKLVGFQVAVINVDQDQTEIEEALATQVPDIPLVVVVNTNSSFASTGGLDAHYLPLKKEEYEAL